LAADGAALESLGAAASALAGVTRFGGELPALAAALVALQSDANEIAVALSRELERADYDPAELEAATERLDLLERLKKKYGGTLAEVAAARERFAAIAGAYAGRAERRTELEASLERAAAEAEGEARALGGLRAAAARELEARVAAELAALAMPAARFAVELQPLETIGASGAERVEFALAPNPGEPLRSLGKAASGGELSRVLLALVVVLADRRERTALVFDEIDAGVGGATANAVGERLGALAATTQVICVTHLAQIASWADRHYALRKRESRETTRIDALELGERETALAELARMLSGSAAPVALEHAAALLADVRKRKADFKLSA
jgi:DNA repair protein RecN (Recombination protein N)